MEKFTRRPSSGGGPACAGMHEEVIRQRDIELEGKNERIRALLAEADALEATAIVAAAVVVAAVLLLLLLAWAGYGQLPMFPGSLGPAS